MAAASSVQTGVSLLVIGAFAAAEGSARALSAWPGSPWLWWLELELFRPFELARAEGSPLHGLFGPATFWLALALMLAVWLARRRPFTVAVTCNLCFAATLALAYGWLDGTGSLRAASLGAVAARPRADLVLVAVMSSASLAGVVLGHASYLRRIAHGR